MKGIDASRPDTESLRLAIWENLWLTAKPDATIDVVSLEEEMERPPATTTTIESRPT